MENKSIPNRITLDPAVMVGKPTIRGVRITVEQILKALANGLTIDQLLEDYPDLERDDVTACLFYATELVDGERVYAVG